MFSRLIIHHAPIFSICSLCNRGNVNLEHNLRLYLRLQYLNRRNISACSQPLCSQQKLKVSVEEQNNEKSNNKSCESQEHLQGKEKESKTIDTIAKNKLDDSLTTGLMHSHEILTRLNKKKLQQWNERDKVFGKNLMLFDFDKAEKKDQNSYIECIRTYESQPGRKIDRVLFIYAALKYMKEFGVEKDLLVYKKLLEIFPKEKMIPTNLFQTMFMHYPKEQFCSIAILQQMEDNGVIPDSETELILLNIFGRHGIPLQKYWAMMYWMPKFKNLNPWPVPKPLPDDTFELAKFAITRIMSVDVESKLTIFDTKNVEDSIDKTWIVSGMAPTQSELLVKHDKKTPIYVEGPFRIYVATKSLDYFTLKAKPIENRKYPEWDPDSIEKIKIPYLETKSTEVILPPTVHEEVDGTIFANCATGTSTKDSLLSWIRLLEKENPVLSDIPIIFTLKNYSTQKVYLGDSNSQQMLENEPNKKS